MGRKTNDVVGKTFKNRTVIKRIANNSTGNTMWECLCNDCGEISEVQTTVLSRNGHNCYKPPKLKPEPKLRVSQLIDIIGSVYNNRTIIEKMGKDKHSKQMWKVKCNNCGSEYTSTKKELKKYSCGQCKVTYNKLYNYKGRMYHSRWEIWVKIFLTSIGLEHQYESKTIQLQIDGKSTKYTPDFYIPKDNRYIEVKGRYGIEKPLQAIKDGYNIDIIEKKDMQRLTGYTVDQLYKKDKYKGIQSIEDLFKKAA